ncbi:MAG: 4Fe-4S binding protein, partial [Pirellulaceae bacterium]|nr:4Fe-4S binding protein [Pirellulaceae bacterium]
DYRINDKCIGCTLCSQHCPVDAIPMTPYERHTIDMDICTRCDTCYQVCPEDAVFIDSEPQTKSKPKQAIPTAV